MTHRILIVGAGTGGTLLANLLAKDLKHELDAGDLEVHVLGDSDTHCFQPGNLDVAFRGVDPERFLHPQRPLLDKRVTFSDEGAERIVPAARQVQTKTGRIIGYDHLVLATGGYARPDLMPGLEGSLSFHRGPREAQRIWDALQEFQGGRIVVAITEVPYKCPPSPNEACFLLDEHLRKRGLREKTSIKLLTPYPHAYPAAAIAEQVEARFLEKGIELGSFFNAMEVDPDQKAIRSLEGEEVPYDLLVAIPPHRGAPVVAESGLADREGWIPVDRETLRVEGHPRTYALGDATALPISKSGVVAHLEALVVHKNILSDLGKEIGEWAYDGRINCPMEVGDHRLLFISATYQRAPEKDKPTVVKYAMKKAFNRLYWTALGGDLEGLFHLYFGDTSEHRLPEGPGETDDVKEDPPMASFR